MALGDRGEHSGLEWSPESGTCLTTERALLIPAAGGGMAIFQASCQHQEGTEPRGILVPPLYPLLVSSPHVSLANGQHALQTQALFCGLGESRPSWLHPLPPLQWGKETGNRGKKWARGLSPRADLCAHPHPQLAWFCLSTDTCFCRLMFSSSSSE